MSRGASIYFASLLINSNMTQDLKTPNSMDLTGLCRENLGLSVGVLNYHYSLGSNIEILVYT